MQGVCFDARDIGCCRHLVGPNSRMYQPVKPPSNILRPSTIPPVEAHKVDAHPETSSSSDKPFGSTQSSSINKNKGQDYTHFLFAI